MTTLTTVPIIGDEHRDTRWTDCNGDVWRYRWPTHDDERFGWQYLNRADPDARWRYGALHIPGCGPYTSIGPWVTSPAVPELGGLREEMDDVLLRAAQLGGAPDADARAELTQRLGDMFDGEHEYDDLNSCCQCGWNYTSPRLEGKSYGDHLADAAVDAFLAYLREQRP